MFTVKHYQRGRVYVRACDSFEYEASQPTQLALINRAGANEMLVIEPGDEVFIENLNGRTVFAIRPKAESHDPQDQ